MSQTKELSPSRRYIVACNGPNGIDLKEFRLPNEYENSTKIAHLFYMKESGSGAQIAFPAERLGNIQAAFLPKVQEKKKGSVSNLVAKPPIPREEVVSTKKTAAGSGTYSVDIPAAHLKNKKNTGLRSFYLTI